MDAGVGVVGESMSKLLRSRVKVVDLGGEGRSCGLVSSEVEVLLLEKASFVCTCLYSHYRTLKANYTPQL